MKRIRVLSLAVTLLGGAFLSLPSPLASQTSTFCGLCYYDLGCPTGAAAETVCDAHCGGSEGPPQCVHNPFCLGHPKGGPMLVCRGNIE